MNIGDTFDTSGYDLICTVPTYEQDIRFEVLNNNSSHYLVAMRPRNMETGAWAPLAELVYEAPYTDEYVTFMAWRACMSVAFLRAKWESERTEFTMKYNAGYKGELVWPSNDSARTVSW